MKYRRLLYAFLPVLTLTILLASSSTARAATFTVNSLGDTGDADATPEGTCNDGLGNCTLREAIEEANALAGADTIHITAAGIILLGTALPVLSTDMTINGPGARILTVQRNSVAAFRIFEVSTSTVSIYGMTVTNGRDTDGAGVKARGTLVGTAVLTLTRVAITDNTATSDAGGGGIDVGQNTTVNVIESTVSSNHSIGSTGVGGGIFNFGGTLSLTNSTISDNDAFQGGGIFATSAGTTLLSNSTIANNTAVFVGGIRISGSHVVTIRSTIIADNTGAVAADMSNGGSSGVFNSEGYNLFEDTTDATINQTQNPGTDITGVDPQLLALFNNGGPTDTHALSSTSPALDKGNSFGSSTDQRGFPRPVDLDDTTYPEAAGGDASDIGAYEFLVPPANKEQCKNGGWQSVFRANGTRFKNQGDCIQYVNTRK